MRRLFVVLLVLTVLFTIPSVAQDQDSPDCDDVEGIVSGLQTLLDNVDDVDDLASISLALRLVYERCDIPGGEFVFAPLRPDDAAGNTLNIVERVDDIGIGSGAKNDIWSVFFTAPLNTRDRSQYNDGIDDIVAAEIDSVQNTLDIAAYELNNERITEAIAAAHERGVRVRIVTDDEHGLEDDDSTVVELELLGIEINDDDRSAFMHNKFMILDSNRILMGSMNFTANGVYRNNNHFIVLRSTQAATVYQAEFDEMFLRDDHGIRSDDSNMGDFELDGIPIRILFAPENNVVGTLLDEINQAETSIHFMIYSFTRDDMGAAITSQGLNGIQVQGVFETTGSQTEFSELGRMYCNGLDVRQDGNNGALHHKVIIIDQETIITGSFNFSNNAVESNDENVLIIQDSNLAALYMEEFQRVWDIGAAPDAGDFDCP